MFDSETHPHEATVTGYFLYSDTDKHALGSVPFSLTIADNCCEEHARLAAERIMESEAKHLNGEETPFGVSVHVIFE